MKNYIFVGCDSHEKTLVLKVAFNREESESKRFGAGRAGRQKLMDYLKEKSRENQQAEVIVTYEASAHGFILADELQGAGFRCHVLAPTKIERSVKEKRSKTDARDAERLLDIVRSHYLAGAKLPAVWIPDRQTRDDREPVRARYDLMQKQATVKTQVQMLLKRNGLEKPEGVGSSWSKPYRRWLEGLRRSAATGPGIQQALASLMRQLEFLEKEVESIDDSLQKLAKSSRREPIVNALMKEKGVGLVTALKYATDIGNFKRFRRGRQVGAFFGLAPDSNESGEIRDRKGHITREGSPSARKALCQAAWSRVQYEQREREFYLRLIQKNPKKKKIALVACMRRLAVRLWQVGLQAQLQMEVTNT